MSTEAMPRASLEDLTPRELEVLELISHGLTNGSVAEQLAVSVHTVKFHLGSVYRKLGVSNRTEAAVIFFQHSDSRVEVSPPTPEPVSSTPALGTSPPPLDLPSDRLPSGQPPRLDTVAAGLDASFVERLTEFAAASGRGTDEIFLAAFAALLARYTGQLDLGMGTVGATLVWRRLDLSEQPTLTEIAARIPAAGIYGSDAASAQVVFAFGSRQAAVLDGASFSLGLSVLPSNEGTRVELRYDANLFDAATVEPMLGHLQALLAGGIATPGTPFLRLPLLTEREQRLLLVEWNQTGVPSPRRCVHELVSDQAARAPQRPAVTGPDKILSYRELETRANQLAHHLHLRGVSREALVGICCERSADMVVGLLGVMRAGAAYVPIDPSYPAERQAFMLEDAQVGVVLTQKHLCDRLPEHDAQVVCIDSDWEQIATLPSHPPEVEHNAEQLAYVIYTSGSTGLPKGVQIPHRALVNFLTSVQHQPGFSADDVLLAVTTLSFDIAGLELYLPLVSGGHVVLASTEAAGNPGALASLLEQNAVTVMQATPTTWRMMVDSGWAGRPRLKALCGGEALPAALADALLERGLELWNLYGPTETTIWSTLDKVKPDRPLTIGRPMANTSVYVLDPHREPVPVGVPGELYIGGHGLARGYLHRPELTADRFVDHPFPNRPGERLYRTGDLVRYRSNGALEFLGRLDHQVKVRGFRIELGEIEAALTRHPSVKAAVVVKEELRPGDARLLAYVVQQHDHASARELRRFVGEALPTYMVPSLVVTVDAFPLTPNGKIDRKALPAPEELLETREGEHTAPRSPLERRLVAIWEEVLGVSPIGVDDDFFDLGATSIVAAQLFVRIEEEFGTTLPLAPVFQAPTIAQLAELLDGGGTDRAWTSLVPIQSRGSKPPLFCVHGGAGTVLHLQPLARRLGPDQPFYGLQARGLYGDEPPIMWVGDMASHYLSELRQIQPKGPYNLAGYCFGGIVAFEMAQRLVSEGEAVRLLAMFNAPSPWYIREHGAARTREVRERQPVQPRRLSQSQRVRRLVREPWRLLSFARWRLKRAHYVVSELKFKQRIRYLNVSGRPLPERSRDGAFLWISYIAEREYTPRVFPGRLILFHGGGLYVDPELGWTGLAGEGIEAYEVPGDHEDNRETMQEPHVSFIAERLERHLAGLRGQAAAESRPGIREAASV